VVNVGDLAEFEAGSRVDAAALLEAKLVRSKRKAIKILGGGEIDRALTVAASAFSETAKAKITAAGGSVEVV
jgi:large subunit ribosomal protein L15